MIFAGSNRTRARPLPFPWRPEAKRFWSKRAEVSTALVSSKHMFTSNVFVPTPTRSSFSATATTRNQDVLSLVTPWFSFQRTRRDCSLGIGSTMPRVMQKAGLEENEFSASWDPPSQLACGRRQMSDKKLKVQVANLCWLAVACQTPREQNGKSRPCFSLFVFAWRVGYRPERKWLTWLRADSQNRMKAQSGTAESIRDFCSQRKKSGSGV